MTKILKHHTSPMFSKKWITRLCFEGFWIEPGYVDKCWITPENKKYMLKIEIEELLYPDVYVPYVSFDREVNPVFSKFYILPRGYTMTWSLGPFNSNSKHSRYRHKFYQK